MYTCFLDASKAFDRVNHWTLHTKIIDSGTPLLIIRIIAFSTNCNNYALNGVGQLTVSLQFQMGYDMGTFYLLRMYGLNNELCKSYVGCYSNYKYINHIMYQHVIQFASWAPRESKFYIFFNPWKSICIVYKPKCYILFCTSVLIGSEPLRHVIETKYLGCTFCNLHKDDKDKWDMNMHVVIATSHV